MRSLSTNEIPRQVRIFGGERGGVARALQLKASNP
jgi:hypothetical protein